jgi:hypothetical protein
MKILLNENTIKAAAKQGCVIKLVSVTQEQAFCRSCSFPNPYPSLSHGTIIEFVKYSPSKFFEFAIRYYANESGQISFYNKTALGLGATAKVNSISEELPAMVNSIEHLHEVLNFITSEITPASTLVY